MATLLVTEEKKQYYGELKRNLDVVLRNYKKHREARKWVKKNQHIHR